MRRARTLREQEGRAGLALISPTLTITLVVVVLPLLWAIMLGFQNVRLINIRQVGLFGNYTLENFRYVLAEPGFWSALANTMIYTVAGTGLSIVIGLVAALALRDRFRGRTLVRASILIPYVAPVVAVTFLWETMLSPQYGEIVSWAIMRDSATDPSARFVSYMMNEGYERWLGMAPEGKFPTREGFAEKWNELQAGVDTKKPLGDIYPPEVLDALRTSPDTFGRWGIPQGQGKLVGAVMGELPVPTALSAAVAGSTTAQEAAAQAQREVESIKRGIRE